MEHDRRSFLAALGAAGTAAVAGCTSGLSAPSAGQNSVGTPEQQSVDLLLNWKPNGLHAPYYAAKAEGFYQDEGFTDVKLRAGKGSDFSAKQVGLGNNAFGVTSADQAVNVNTRGVSPQAVATVMQKSPVVLFTTRDGFGETFTDVTQLKGKKIGTGPGMVRLMTKLLLERKGVLDSVELVDTGYSTVQKLLAGKVDAAGGVFADAISAESQGYTTDSVRVADHIPSYGHVIVGSEQLTNENPKTVESFLRATARGAAWAQQHPGKAIDHLVAANEALSETRDIQQQKWTTMAEEFVVSETVQKQGWGYSVSKPWEVTYDVLNDAGLLKGELDPASVWTNDYLDTDYQYIGSYHDAVTK